MLSLPIAGARRFLFIGAHSDDIEIGCGGTLLRLLDERPGSTVTWVVFSADDEREAEARRSASAMSRSASPEASVTCQASWNQRSTRSGS